MGTKYCGLNYRSVEEFFDRRTKTGRIISEFRFYYITFSTGGHIFTYAIEDFIAEIKSHKNSIEKLKLLFQSILSSELKDKNRNVIRELHLQNDIVTNYKLMMASIKVISPIVTELLVEGSEKGELHAEYPEESSRMIVAMLTFLLDNYFFPDSAENRMRSLKLYSLVLETCLKA